MVMDGPLDPLWVEGLNSVLDDSRVLCLGNGERLSVSEKMVKIVFEVGGVEKVSPATISRCGLMWVGGGEDTGNGIVR